MAVNTRPRTAARVAAVQALFQGEQAQTPAETVIDEFVRHRLGDVPDKHGVPGGFDDGRAPDANVPLFARIVRTATVQQDVLDGLLGGVLDEEWPMPRLDPVLRALLRAATAELWMPDGPPARVVINEYLDIAHGFFDGDEPAMANGVLDHLARRLRPKEFPGEGVSPIATG